MTPLPAVARADRSPGLSFFRPRASLTGVCLLAWASWSLAAPAGTPAGSYRARVVVFVAEGLTFSDLVCAWDAAVNGTSQRSRSFPCDGLFLFALPRLARQGAIGLMSPTVVGEVTPESACLSLGAGCRTSAPPELAQAYDVDEKVGGVTAGERYRRLTGWNPPATGVVNLGILAARRQSAASHSLAQPGWLGDWLGKRHFTAGIWGNADAGGQRRRQVTALVMDSHGVIPYGTVAESLSLAMPGFGVRGTDVFTRLLERCDVIVVDLGCPGTISPENAPFDKTVEKRKASVWWLDHQLTSLMGLLDPSRTSVLLLSAFPADLAPTRLRLTPWLLIVPNRTTGLLTSESTRRTGLVSNVDFAPTVIALLGQTPPSGLPGHRVGVATALPRRAWAAADRLEAMNARQVAGYRIVIPVCVGLGVGALLLSLTALLGGERISPEIETGARKLLLATVTAPLPVVLLAPLLPEHDLLLVAALLGASLLLGVTCYHAGAGSFVSLCIALAVLAVVLTVDAFNGGKVMCNGLFGQWAVYGRFYGIGNTETGVLLGCLLMLAGGLLSMRPEWGASATAHGLVFGLLGVGLAAVGLPRFGANLGGVVTGTAGVVFAALTLRRPRLRGGRRLLLSAAAAVAVGLAVTAIDALQGNGGSHLAGAWGSLHQDGLRGPVTIWLRKAAHNLWLLNFSPVLYVLVAVVAVFSYSLYKGPPRWREAWQRFPAFRAAFQAVPVAAGTALLVNDSGVAMMATMMLIVAPTFAYVLLETESSRCKREDAA